MENTSQTIQQATQQSQFQSIVISNGLRIQSKLNPAAKEFYPSHMMRRNQVFHEIIKETKSSERFLENISEEISSSKSKLQKRVETEREGSQLEMSYPVEPTVSVPATTDIAITTTALSPSIPGPTSTASTPTSAAITPTQTPTLTSTLESTKDVGEKTEDLMKAENEKKGDENTPPKNTDKIKDVEELTDASAKQVSVEKIVVEDHVCGDGLAITAANEILNNEKNEIKPEMDNEADIKIPDNTEKGAQSLPVDQIVSNEKTETVVISEEQEVKTVDNKNDEIIAENVGKVDTKLNESTKTRNKNNEEQQKKMGVVKKPSTIKRVSKIALNSLKKATSNHSSAHSSTSDTVPNSSQIIDEKSTTSKSATASCPTASVSRTKRLSESLHSLSSTLKSKSSMLVDGRSAENTAKNSQRCPTTISKIGTSSRNLLGRAKPDANGNLVKRETSAVKNANRDALSLKSTSSTEKSLASKSSLTASTHSTSNSSSRISMHKLTTNFLPAKTSAGKVITRTPITPSTPVTPKNPKDSAQKFPRGTVASSLRQTEAQKVS